MSPSHVHIPSYCFHFISYYSGLWLWHAWAQFWPTLAPFRCIITLSLWAPFRFSIMLFVFQLPFIFMNPPNVQNSNMLAFKVLSSLWVSPKVIITQLPSFLIKNTCVSYWASKSTYMKKYLPHYLLKKSYDSNASNVITEGTDLIDSKQCHRCFCISRI